MLYVVLETHKDVVADKIQAELSIEGQQRPGKKGAGAHHIHHRHECSSIEKEGCTYTLVGQGEFDIMIRLSGLPYSAMT